MGRIEIEKLSPEAQELIRLTKDIIRSDYDDWRKADVEKLLLERPELLKGLNEYLAWRDESMKTISETKKSVPVAHELRQLANKLRDRKAEK